MRAAALLLGAMAGCAGDARPGEPPGPLLLAVEQDGRPAPASEETVRLRRAPFTLVFRTPGPGGVHVNAWPTPLTFDRLFGTDDLHRLPGFTFRQLAERPFNPSEYLWVQEDSSHHWYARGERDHRFSEVRDGEARRRISRINEAPVEAWKEPALYLCIVEAVDGRVSRRQRAVLSFEP